MTGWILTKKYKYSGGTIRYDIHGSGSPLVLVHGTPWSSFSWRHIIPALAKNWTVYLYDLLGYGQSEKRDGQDVSLGVQNQVLAELLDHWRLDIPYIVGHDFGGTTVLRTHLIEKRDFKKIVLIDPVSLAPWGSPFFLHVKTYEKAFHGVPAYIHEALVTAYVRGATYRPMSDETLSGIMRPWLGSAGQNAFYRQIAQAEQRFTDEVESLYGEITRPVLILWGEQDQWIPVTKGNQLHNMIPTSQFCSIPNAGHLVQEDAPETLVSFLVEFFSENTAES